MMTRSTPLVIVLTILLVGGFGSAQDTRQERPFTGDLDEPLTSDDLVTANGFTVRSVADRLEFPVAIDWDDDGNTYLGMAGFAYGLEGFDSPHVARLHDNGTLETIASDFEPPLIDITWHDGALYVSARSNVTRVDVETGEREVVLSDLPSSGDHHTNEVTFGPDGRLYVPIGIATNALVVGIENQLPGFGWTSNITRFADIPCQTVTLAGVNYVTQNPFLIPEEPTNMSAVVVQYDHEDAIPDSAWGTEGENVTTGAYVPFGTPTHRGQEIEGAVPCTGAVLVAEADGSGLDWYAWGFRNPYGLKFDDEGRMWLAQNGADVRGSRPVHASPDRLWLVEEGTWYGYSDFEGGVPINDTRFAPPGEDPIPRLLFENPANATTPPPPALNLSVHAAVTKFDFAPGGAWGDKRQVYMALYGDNAPATGPPGEHSGHAVVRFHLDTLDPQRIETILRGEHEIDRRFRPVEAAFGPDGDLWVVNIGVVSIEQLPIGPDADPQRATGALYVLTADDEGEDVAAAGIGLLLVALVGLLAAGRRPAWRRSSGPNARSALATLVVLAFLVLATPADARTLEVYAAESRHEYFFTIGTEPGQNPVLRVDPGAELTFQFTNAGNQYHNLRLGPPIDNATDLLGRGASESIGAQVEAGASYVTQYWCEPHKEIGMFGYIVVGDAEAPEKTVPGAGLGAVLIALVVLLGRMRPPPV